MWGLLKLAPTRAELYTQVCISLQQSDIQRLYLRSWALCGLKYSYITWNILLRIITSLHNQHLCLEIRYAMCMSNVSCKLWQIAKITKTLLHCSTWQACTDWYTSWVWSRVKVQFAWEGIYFDDETGLQLWTHVYSLSFGNWARPTHMFVYYIIYSKQVL